MVGDVLNEFFSYAADYQFDGECGEPVIAHRWRRWTDSGCTLQCPTFRADQLSCHEHDQLVPHPAFETWDPYPDVDEITDAESEMLRIYRDLIPYGLSGLRASGQFDFSSNLLAPLYRGNSFTVLDRYRRQIWSSWDFDGEHYSNQQTNSSPADAVTNRIPVYETFTTNEIEELEAAVMQEDQEREEERRRQQNQNRGQERDRQRNVPGKNRTFLIRFFLSLPQKSYVHPLLARYLCPPPTYSYFM